MRIRQKPEQIDEVSTTLICMQSPKRRERLWKSQRVRERRVFSMTSIMREREREMKRKWVFWLNIAKFEVNWCYRYCFNLFSNLRKESELPQYHCWNSTKVGERKIKSRREKFWFLATPSLKFLLPIPATRVGARSECAQGKPNVGKKNWQLWQCHCRKWEEKKNSLRQW